jgi:hypothetical protein
MNPALITYLAAFAFICLLTLTACCISGTNRYGYYYEPAAFYYYEPTPFYYYPSYCLELGYCF